VKFKDPSNLKRFDSEYLSNNCLEWLSTCVDESKRNISNIFKYANNLKSLVLIRDGVIQFESSLSNESSNWSDVCQHLFKKKIELWKELIAPFYYSQSKVFRLS
jgi:hypothetical protein